jgi:3-dehydroquinate dehydratase
MFTVDGIAPSISFLIYYSDIRFFLLRIISLERLFKVMKLKEKIKLLLTARDNREGGKEQFSPESDYN